MIFLLTYPQFSMNLNLPKSFPLLKLKPNIMKALQFDVISGNKPPFNENDHILNFQDLVNIDYHLCLQIWNIKNQISIYIKNIKKCLTQEVEKTKNRLIQSLKKLVIILEKLELENIEKDIEELFEGSSGIYRLIRYVWSPDILILLFKIKDFCQTKKQKAENDDKFCDSVYSKFGLKYFAAIQQMMHDTAKSILKEFICQMYIIPLNWGKKLAKDFKLSSSAKQVLSSDQQSKIKSQRILQLFIQDDKDQNLVQWKGTVLALLLLQIQKQFYSYITLMKNLLLNKKTGILNGDYETWEQIYDVCLKIYVKNEAIRTKEGQSIQIDQIVQNRYEDAEFTNFLIKSKGQRVSLASINFYFKNCPKSAQNLLRPVIMQKISYLADNKIFVQFEDIFEFLQTEADANQKQIIIYLLHSCFKSTLIQGIGDNQNICGAYKAIPDLIEFAFKNSEYFKKLFSNELMSLMSEILSKEKINLKNQAQKQKSKVQFIYFLINSLFIQSYEEQFDLEKDIEESSSLKANLKQIAIKLKNNHSLQLHQDALSIICQWFDKNDKNGSQSQVESEESIISQKSQFGKQFGGQVVFLMLNSGRDCDFKLQTCFSTECKKQTLVNEVNTQIKILTETLQQEAKEIEKMLFMVNNKSMTQQQKIYCKSFLVVKGLKDKLIHENIINLGLKMHPILSFAQICQSANEFLTFMTPQMVDDPQAFDQQYAIQPFDICDIASGEQPIECMKLIYKQTSQFIQENFDFDCLQKIPLPLVKNLISCKSNHQQLVRNIIQLDVQLPIQTVEKFGKIRKFLFYCQLMNKVFCKLNEKSQKGIKEIKIIFSSMQRICNRIWVSISSRVVSSEIYHKCKDNMKFNEEISEMKGFPSSNLRELQSQALQYYHNKFNFLVKNVRLPYLDSILLQTNYITKTCEQFISSLVKSIYPEKFSQYYLKMFDPLKLVKIQSLGSTESREFTDCYEFIGQIVKFLAMVEFTCCSQQFREREQHKQWSIKWRKNCKQLIQILFSRISNKQEQLDYKISVKRQKSLKSLQVNVYLIHLKAQIIKILLPFLLKDPLKCCLDTPKQYHRNIEDTFSIFIRISEIIEKISPGQEEHLMTFLQIFQNFDENSSSSNKQTSSCSNGKVGQFLYKSIQSLLELVFKGIRVRSYHFYKFIRSYQKLTREKQNSSFFNSVIAFYIQKLIRNIIPQFRLPPKILNLCDENMNPCCQVTRSVSEPECKQNNIIQQNVKIINETGVKKGITKMKFENFTKFQVHFELKAEMVCVISMFINLFCRLNYTSLSEGIEKIWETQQMHLVYVRYLQEIVKVVGKQFRKVEKKLLDIINVDCFGNISIIIKNPLVSRNNFKKMEKDFHGSHQIILELLKLIQLVVNNEAGHFIKNSLTLPVKKIVSELKTNSTHPKTIDYISEMIQDLKLSKLFSFHENSQKSEGQTKNDSGVVEVLDMITTCYNIMLTRGISSQSHLSNLLYVSWDSEMKVRIFQNNMAWLEKRMTRKQIRYEISKYLKHGDVSKIQKRRSSICKQRQMTSKQQQNFKSGQIKVTQRSKMLISQIINNFIDSYFNVFQNLDSDWNGQQQQDKNSSKQSLMTLFNNMKILTVITINNPEVTIFWDELKSMKHKATIQQVILDSAEKCLPVFCELYMTRLKTNFGYAKQKGQQKVIPNNLLFQVEIKNKIIERLQKLLKQKQKKLSKLENLLNCIQFLVKVSLNESKPSFRSYKFGNISNKFYWQAKNKHDDVFLNNLLYVLKSGLQNWNKAETLQNSGKQFLNILMKFNLVLNKALKPSDLSFMKISLDIQLGKINHFKEEQVLQPKQKKFTALQKIDQNCSWQRTRIDEISFRSQQIVCEINNFVRYDFQAEILDQNSFTILRKMNLSSENLSLLQKLIDYCSKHSVWEDLCENQSILLCSNRINHQSSANLLTTQDSNTRSPLSSSINHLTINGTSEQIRSGMFDQGSLQITNSFEQLQQEPNFSPQVGRQVSIQQRLNQSQDKLDNNFDGIIEESEDGIIEDDPVDQIKECMSQTSLQFLSSHSVKCLQQQDKKISNITGTQSRQFTKQFLVQLYQESVINPQARKSLINAISFASIMHLEKFIANQSVDQELQIIVIRELWNRGFAPSSTSISKKSRYYGNFVEGQSKSIERGLNLYINQALIYKKMYQQYKDSESNPTQKYLIKFEKQILQYTIYYQVSNKSLQTGMEEIKIWDSLQKIALDPNNCRIIIQICLSILSSSDSELEKNIFSKFSLSVKGQLMKLLVINDILTGCIKDRVGLKLILDGYWVVSQSIIQLSEREDNKVRVPILQWILKQSHLINEVILESLNPGQKTNSQFILRLWEYFESCDQFKIHEKIEKNLKMKDKSMYPYYQLQQSIKISENILRKIVQKIFTVKVTIGRGYTKREDQQKQKSLEKLFLILVYLDPTSFQIYFKLLIEKIGQKLSFMIKKQHKILNSFQSYWMSNKEGQFLEMEKQEKYWNLHQSKKSKEDFEENFQYFRNVLVDLSINLLPQFKNIRFNYHCGKNYRQWKLQIQILKQKLLSYSSILGLSQLQQKQRKLEEWKRDQCNKIINEEVLPIIQSNSQLFIPILVQAQQFIIDFLDTFEPKEQKQKIVIYHNCVKIYQIILAAEILTHEEKPTYHSMSKLKTAQSIESSNNIYGIVHRRKSSLQVNRKSIRTSINTNMPTVTTLLKTIGPSCTFLSTYIGSQQQIRELHAKYSDVNKRLKVLWDERNQASRRQGGGKEKVIQVRRSNIVEDTLIEIDEQFIALPIKIKFEGQIGVDYGGVTRQWITLFMKQIINPELGLFQLSVNKMTFQPNRNSSLIPNHLRYFKKIGILVGKAMKQNWLLQVNLTKSFLKHLLGSTLYVEDLEDIDPQTAKSLKWILDNPIGFSDELGLNFTYQIQRLGKKQILQLIPNGANIVVTDQNKKKYVKLIANMKMTEQIREQSKAFISGLESVIPYSTLNLFSYKQISLYLSGMPTIDMQQMKEYAKYENFTAESNQIIWFWNTLLKWSQEELANFLFFLTGSYKVQYGGFKKYPIGLHQMIGCTNYLPVAHTCFSVIDLSNYSSEQKLRKLLKKAITEGKGFSVS